MEFENLQITKKEGIAQVAVHRPDKLNALNGKTIDELFEAFDHLQGDGNVHVIILTGSGSKAFVAGADIKELSTLSPHEGKLLSLKGQELTLVIERSRKPVICAINGYALGGGLELALSCHIRIASESAKLGLPEVTLGIIPGYGGTQRLPRIVGRGKALEMILTGAMIPAVEAEKMGLVNQVTPPEELIPTCEAMAKKMMENGPLALAMAIEAVERGYEMSLPEALKLEADLFGFLCATDDMKEGTKAFLEKRKAEFKGK